MNYVVGFWRDSSNSNPPFNSFAMELQWSTEIVAL